MPRWTRIFASLLLLGSELIAAFLGQPSRAEASTSACYAFVTNSGIDTVSIIDTTATPPALVGTITVGNGPGGIAFSPDGTRVYVANSRSDTVSIIDTTATPPALVGTITVGNGPSSIAFSSDGAKAYVTNGVAGTVSVIDTTTEAVIGPPIAVGAGPSTVAIGTSRLGNVAFVSNFIDGTVSVIDTAVNVVPETILTFSGPSGIASSPDGTRVYVANYGSDTVSVINTTTSPSNIDAIITVGDEPVGVAFSPDGTKAYVTNSSSNSLSIINTSTGIVTTLPLAGIRPVWVAISPDGSRAFVTNNGSGTLSVIDTSTYVITNLPVGALPARVAVGCVAIPTGRSAPKRTVTFDPAGGTCSDHRSPWMERFRHSRALPSASECSRAGYVFLGWTRDPALTAPEYLLTRTISRSADLTAVWGALPAAPASVKVLANFLCGRDCTSALVVWPVGSDTAVITVDGLETTCSTRGEGLELRWCLVAGLASGTNYTASVSLRNQYGEGPATTVSFSLQ